MCWSFEISIASGLFSYTVGAYLWLRNYKNDRWHAIILFTFSTIQFMEAIIWYSSGCASGCINECKNKQNNINNSFSILIAISLIPLILALEPVASLYGAHYMGYKIDTIDIIIYAIAFCYILYSMNKSSSYPNVIENGGIEYSKDVYPNNDTFISLLLFFALVMYPLLKYSNFGKFYVMLSILLFGTLTLAMLRGHAISSSWCLYSNAFAGICLFYPYMS
ncbi:MAG: hypothetical protein Edafosvirus11_35 [Edafosvirus sp.]|uniref:Uncharacterized protein n=1 Tax=Edafosvirus sp. TaxID=2487765 RepID=A0A3G4ZU24_9VIRU|nr:MAG: hypothetical protein Edafosvirus11_35 [Edafosvirus sp.]